MPNQATAFALIGDRYHNSDYIRTALRRTLAQGLGLDIDFTDDVTLLNAENLSGYRLLILFRDGMIWPNGYGESAFWNGRADVVPITSDPPLPALETRMEYWMTAAQGKAVRSFVEQGGSALLMHNVTYIATDNADFRHTLGAATEGHPPVRAFKVEITNRAHPIMQGASDFVVTDEQHYMTYDNDPQHVLMRSHNEDGLTYKELGTSCEAGWAYDYGQGRVCYLAPGHTIAALWNPVYVGIQQNAVRWLLRQI
ncbi:MAG: ThuA domain-containing protein [Chloroflexi bacterium]|nr:ThuA domain-containing protein [Chloroflexota bacterium]